MKFCAEHRYTYMSVYAPTRVVRRWFDGYREAAAELGYVPDPEKIALSIPIYVADTEKQAHAEARERVDVAVPQGTQARPGDHDSPGIHVARLACAAC